MNFFFWRLICLYPPCHFPCQAVTWNGEELGANFDVTPLAESTLVDDALKASAQKYHEELVELVVEQDEDALMAYLEVRKQGQKHL